MYIIQVPSIYALKLSGGEWLNLARIRRLQADFNTPAVEIIWDNGDRQVYSGDKALAIIMAWSESTVIDKSEVEGNHS